MAITSFPAIEWVPSEGANRMQYRTLGRTGWPVSEIGYGMWGMAGWSGSEDAESLASLERAVELGCTFFDTAWGYGAGHSERLLGKVVRAHPDKTLTVATKIPPKNFTWPSRRGFTLDECFPPDHIREYAEKSLANLGLPSIDLLQFHVWEDAWANDDRWQKAMDALKSEGLIRAVGVSVNRWEPTEVVETLRTGMIDAVQVIYNIFDQAPEDELFPLCRERNIGVIARVPFDEGTLTGNLTLETKFPPGDWRGGYFNEENLRASVAHAEKLRADIPPRMTMAELALRWILQEPTVSTVIPGMRKIKNVEANVATSDGTKLDPALMARLRGHRWDRVPTAWSQ
ncbi:MAG: yhdN 6 [Planctomycetota bacterium]|nr:yhdN 6 [Planctomycetota bacterium]